VTRPFDVGRISELQFANFSHMPDAGDVPPYIPPTDDNSLITAEVWL